jgi:hypothetical protein
MWRRNEKVIRMGDIRMRRLESSSKYGGWRWALLLGAFLMFADPALASDPPPVEAPIADSVDIFGEGTAVIYTKTLIAPQYYKGTLLHHMYFKFAFVVDEEEWQDINRQSLQLREAILEELNRYSFARRGAPKQLNIAGLKNHLLRRARTLFGDSSIKEVYLMSAISGRA